MNYDGGATDVCVCVCVCVWCSLSQYARQCEWLSDAKFLRDLESDSVDSDILDEELQALELRDEKTSVAHAYIARSFCTE